MLGVSSLTTAELRLLPFLPHHLSLAEISERLFVSRNTVKSQAISIYRKFGGSSRSETITRITSSDWSLKCKPDGRGYEPDAGTQLNTPCRPRRRG